MRVQRAMQVGRSTNVEGRKKRISNATPGLVVPAMNYSCASRGFIGIIVWIAEMFV